MVENTSLQGSCIFRGVEYAVNMQVKDGCMLSVTVKDVLTTNQWQGCFDSAYIEDMTHKTGNYKQFHIFVNMMESAISETSDAVSMDLLTFNDLELLRKRKAGVDTPGIPGASSSALTQKRYLILTYAVEFDKIHYPLPLSYAGKPDPEILQENIRKMQAEIKLLKSQETKNYKTKELEKLKLDYDQLLAEKEAIKEEYILYRKQLKNTAAGASTKEIRVLKSVIKNLEEELMKEKAKHQRMMSKRRKDTQDLQQEVQDLRASERTLKVRIKSLTNELAVYKRKAVTAEHSRPLTRQSRPNSARATRGQANISGGSTGTSFYRNRSSSRERGRSLSADRGHSAERRTNSRYDNSQPRLKSSLAKSSSPFHRQSSPYDRLSHHRSGIPSSQGNSRNTFHKTPSPRTALKPSPAGTRKPRFDPTAYITEKKRRQETKNNIRGTRSSPNLDGLHSRGRSRERVAQQPPRRRNRHSSVESIGSVGSVRRSRNSSCSEGNMSDSSHASSQYRVTKQRRAWQGDSPSEDIYTKKHSIRPSTSTPHSDRLTTRDNLRSDSLSEYLNHSADIDDIDARIQRINDMINERI